MAHLYFTRHGQTFWNVENKICGATDIGLTELGHSQARSWAEKYYNREYILMKYYIPHYPGAADTGKAYFPDYGNT